MIAINLVKNFLYSIENQLTFALEDLEEKDYYIRVDESTPAIGWMLGHILISHDFIVNRSLLGNEQYLPKDIIKTNSTGSSGNVDGDYRPADMLNDLKTINKIIVEKLLTKGDEWFEEQPLSTKGFPDHWLGKNNMKVLVFHINHALNHTGEILEIKRRLGKRVWGV